MEMLPQAMTHGAGEAYMLYAQGLLQFLLPLGVFLFEASAPNRRRMLPFVVLRAGTSLYMLWALMTYLLEISVRGNSIVYYNQGTQHTPLAVLYIIATCGSLFFSRVRDTPGRSQRR